MTDLLRLQRYAGHVLFGLLLLAAGSAACAQDAPEVSRLIRLGQFGPASEKIEAALAKNSKDPQARFLKGVLQSEQGKPNDAIATFQLLTEDYPELPEPYNNLASLFAAKGQYEKAKTALEMAIQINPGYSTAYENLGDVYAKMASQAYDKALQLDKANTTAAAKLASIRNAFPTAAKPAAPASAPPTRGETPKPAASTSVPVAVTPVAALAAVVAVAAPAPSAGAATRAAESGAILAAVNAWASAWASRNVDGYMAAYSKSFVPEGKTREEWENKRRSSFPAAKGVHVEVEQPQVNLVGADQAQVTFLQKFRSDRVKLNTRKELLLAREDGAWHIARERIVP